MISLSYTIDDAKALTGMLDLVIKVLGQNVNGDNAENMTVEITRASNFRKGIIATLKDAEEELKKQLEAKPPASPAPAASPAVN